MNTDEALQRATDATIEATTREVLLGLLLLCELVQERVPGAKYVTLDDSDQGDSAAYRGALANADDDPYADDLDVEGIDDDGASMHLYDSHWLTLQPYMAKYSWDFQWSGVVIDIAKVLADTDKITGGQA